MPIQCAKCGTPHDQLRANLSIEHIHDQAKMATPEVLSIQSHMSRTACSSLSDQLRRVELGDCFRPYGMPCVHEHACFSELRVVAHETIWAAKADSRAGTGCGDAPPADTATSPVRIASQSPECASTQGLRP